MIRFVLLKRIQLIFKQIEIESRKKYIQMVSYRELLGQGTIKIHAFLFLHIRNEHVQLFHFL